MMTQLKTVNIKGKDYVEVAERIKYFRSSEQFKGWSLTTEVIEMNDKRCCLKGIVKNPEQISIAEGIAYETADSSFINKGSYIENCETSAWGRALGNLGIGIDGGVASAEEVIEKSVREDNIELMKARASKAKKGNVSFDKVLNQFKADYGELTDKTINELKEHYENTQHKAG